MSYAQANHAKDQELLAEEPLLHTTPSTLKRAAELKEALNGFKRKHKTSS